MIRKLTCFDTWLVLEALNLYSFLTSAAISIISFPRKLREMAKLKDSSVIVRKIKVLIMHYACDYISLWHYILRWKSMIYWCKLSSKMVSTQVWWKWILQEVMPDWIGTDNAYMHTSNTINSLLYVSNSTIQSFWIKLRQYKIGNTKYLLFSLHLSQK